MSVFGKTINGAVAPFDFTYKNNFKSRVWTYLRRNPSLNFRGYQNASKDMQCKQEAFNEVKKDIELWGIWDPKELSVVPKTPSNMERIEALNHQAQPHKELPPSTPTEPQKPEPHTVGNQVALANIPTTKRRKLDAELKELVREEFRKKPTITYDELQKAVNWPAFTKTNYYQVRQELIRMGEFDASLVGAPGRKASGDILLARKNLMSISAEEARPMNYGAYKQHFGHHGISAQEFLRAHHWAMSQRAEKRRPKGEVSSPVQAPAHPIVLVQEPDTDIPVAVALPKNTYTIMATVAINESIPPAHHKAIKEMFAAYFDERLAQAGRKTSVECRLMTDPACIEIRRVAK